MIPMMQKVYSFTNFLTSDPSPFPSLLLILLIFTFHIPKCRFFSYHHFPWLPLFYYNCVGNHKILCNPIPTSSPRRLPSGGWALRAAPIALLVVVSWLSQKESAGVAARKWGSQGCHVSTISEHKAEDEEIGGCTPWVLVGIIVLLFNMAQRQALIRHCLFVRSMWLIGSTWLKKEKKKKRSGQVETNQHFFVREVHYKLLEWEFKLSFGYGCFVEDMERKRCSNLSEKLQDIKAHIGFHHLSFFFFGVKIYRLWKAMVFISLLLIGNIFCIAFDWFLSYSWMSLDFSFYQWNCRLSQKKIA